MDFCIFILYNYFRKGAKKDIAFQSTLMMFSMLFFINLLTVFMMFGFDYDSKLISFSSNKKIEYLFRSLIIWIPIYILLNVFFKENRFKKKKFSKSTIRRGGYFFVTYVFLSLFLAFYFAKQINS